MDTSIQFSHKYKQLEYKQLEYKHLEYKHLEYRQLQASPTARECLRHTILQIPI